MIRQWGDAPEWATHIVAPSSSPESEMWAELIDGSYYSAAHRVGRASAFNVTDDFSFGIQVVSARPLVSAQPLRVTPPPMVALDEPEKRGRPVTVVKTVKTPKVAAPPPAVVEGVDIEVSKLGGQLLCWAVALATKLNPSRKADGTLVCDYPWRGEKAKQPIPDFLADFGRGWLFLGQLGISLHAPRHESDVWAAWIGEGTDIVQGGNTAQEAICRCVVVLHLGLRVRVPTELMELTV